MFSRFRAFLALMLVGASLVAVDAAQAQVPQVAARVVFDDKHLNLASNMWHYHGWRVYDVNGAPLLGSAAEWTAVVSGVNGPLTFTGKLDYNGRGVFRYHGVNKGLDTITVTVAPAVGEATRTYSIGPTTIPADEPRPPLRIEFDDNHLSHGTPYYGYHGWQVYDQYSWPIIGSNLEWTAVVAGPNGPLTFNGHLDYYGRGVFGYQANNPGTDVLTVTIGSATGEATRSYQAGLLEPEPVPTVTPPPIEPDPLPSPEPTLSPIEPEPSPTPEVPKATVAAPTPQTSLQVWQMNINQLQQDEWRGAIRRLALNPFAPDIILLQDIANCDRYGADGADFADEFMVELRTRLGSQWSFAHAQQPKTDDCSSTGGKRRNAVVWNNERLSQVGAKQVFDGANGTPWLPTCAQVSDFPLAVELRDQLTQRDVVAASVHLNNAISQSCLSDSMNEVDAWLDNSFPTRDMTIFAGDLNQRPERDDAPYPDTGEPASNGLETDPDCWYRGFSAPHSNSLISDPLDTCRNFSPVDSYYDTVWMHPGSGGGTNPIATSFCQQFTHIEDIDLLAGTLLTAAANSCTNIEGRLDGPLDRARIDYIWVSWHTPTSWGSPDWTPPLPVAASLVEYAGADSGIDLTDSLRDYSDHRAVQALLTWPSEEIMAIPPPL